MEVKVNGKRDEANQKENCCRDGVIRISLNPIRPFRADGFPVLHIGANLILNDVDKYSRYKESKGYLPPEECKGGNNQSA